jgi:hypothetical protein
MMKPTGPRGLGEQGLLGAPPTAHKNKPKFFMYNTNTHTPHNTHTHNCGCTQSNINTDTNATGEERDRNNIDTTSGITTDKELRDIREADITQPSESVTVTEVTNVSREERDQNNTDTTDGPMRSKRTEPVGHQGIKTLESEQSPKKARLSSHQPDKRKRNDQGTPDLGPSCKRRSPTVPQDIPSGRGEGGRSDSEACWRCNEGR